MQSLDKFYTESQISDLLVSFISGKPKNILELGVGNGSLLKSAIKKWSNASFSGFDIDKKAIEKLENNYPKIKFGTVDVLNLKKIKYIINKKSFDIAICNPPYAKLKYTKKYDSLYSNLNFENTFPISSDIIFLMQNLIYLKKNGTLGIILPDSIITNFEYYNFRKQLLQNFFVERIIELPDKIFKKTEAKTYIVIIKKIEPKDNIINLLLANRNGDCLDSIKTKASNLYDRMDFSFIHWKLSSNYNLIKSVKLGDLAVLIRGNIPHKDLKNCKQNYIHSTSFKNYDFLKFDNYSFENTKQKLALPNDILVVRVGRGCIGKICFIEKGYAIISDCIIVIRCKNKVHSKSLYNYLKTEEFRKWVNANKHGVCASSINKSILESMLIPTSILNL